ncbi:MAG: DUF91 domain-containing protein [Candidatus Marinimicrobia bacterium]|nr:DUF91 domain-containing protein [Candidatus Neomarinimicrobiota bacterium]
MDDVLNSNPQKFKMLRAFWKVSFLKFGDEENQAIKDIILKNNQDVLQSADDLNSKTFETGFETKHHEISEKLQSSIDYTFNVDEILQNASEGSLIKHEMAIEAGLLHQLSEGEEETTNVFGKWDYLSHQVVASPFKPIDYMDKMDIFGYRYIAGFKPTKSKFMVIEIKRDEAKSEDIDQLLKYVDWLKEEYVYGDYSMVEAYLVASGFNAEVKQYLNRVGIRKFTIGQRPARSEEWSNINIVQYSYNSNSRLISFRKISE